MSDQLPEVHHRSESAVALRTLLMQAVHTDEHDGMAQLCMRCWDTITKAAPQVAVALRRPDVWENAAAAIGKHPHEYDMSDSSERLDVVQIVCEALATVFVDAACTPLHFDDSERSQ